MMRKWMAVGGWWFLAMSAQAQMPDTTLAWLTQTAADRHPSVRAAAYAAAGARERADVLRLEMEREEFASMIRRLDIESAATDAVIRRLAGLDDSESFTPPSGPIRPLTFTPPDSASHPMLAESEAMADEAARMARIATLETRPMIGLGVEFMGPSYLGMGGETMLVPSVSISLPVWRTANRARIAESASLAASAAESASSIRLALANEREEAWSRYREAVIRVDLYGTSLLPRSVELADLTLAEYSGGRASADEVIRARRETLDIQMRLAEAQSDRNTAVAILHSLYPESK